MTSWSCLALAGLLLGQVAMAESFRCGQWIVSEESTAAEILQKCGEPTTRHSETADVYGPSVSGAGRVRRGTTTTEIWTYDRGSGASRMIVTIVDGKVRSIERGS